MHIKCMNVLSHTYYSTFKWRMGLFVSLVILMLALVQDLLHAGFKGYTFYLSESLLFNSFWLMFLPLMYLQAKCNSVLNARYKKNILVAIVLSAALFSLAQFLLYPLIVFSLSFVFFNNTFSLEQTLQFSLSQYLHITIIIYSLAALVKYLQPKKPGLTLTKQTSLPVYLDYLNYTSGIKTNRIAVDNIICIRSQPPYIAIFTTDNKILIPGTLTSIIKTLDPSSFIRVHRSGIIRIQKVESFKSRLNGDYDITMQNNMMVRLSRNFSSNFKAAMSSTSLQHKNSSG